MLKRLDVKKALLGVAVAVLASGGAQPVSAQTRTISDPVGDVRFNAPPFQDIVIAQVTKTERGGFRLVMGMGGPVPGAPPRPRPGVNEIWWVWGFDLDSTTFPRGYPFTPTPAGEVRVEFVVYVGWDGTEFAANAIDRRPLLTGGEAIITPVPFSINGTMVEVDLGTVMGDVPPGAVWNVVTFDWSGPVGSEGANVVDGVDHLEVVP
jgi:hypothetical protein